MIDRVLVTGVSDKVSSRTVPDAVVRLIGLFDREVRGLVGFLGKHVGSDPSATVRDLGWTPIPFEKTVLDMAASLEAVVEG